MCKNRYGAFDMGRHIYNTNMRPIQGILQSLMFKLRIYKETSRPGFKANSALQAKQGETALAPLPSLEGGHGGCMDNTPIPLVFF